MVGAFLGLVFMLVFYILELVGIFSLSKTVHIALVGLGVTVIGCIIGSFFGKPKYFGQKGWELKATATNREDIKLDAQMKDVLTLIRRGHSTYSDIVDYLGKDMADVNASVEALDRGGYIERESLRGGGFFHFHITEKGWNAITVSAEEDALNKKKLSAEYVPVLNAVNEGGAKALGLYAKENKIGSLRLSAIISHLVRCGYMTDNKGLNSAKYEMTSAGVEVLKSV